MYDDNKLHRSEFYFSLLQLLRIFSGLINQSMADLKSLAAKSNVIIGGLRSRRSGHFPELAGAAVALENNWDMLVARQAGFGGALLGRIERRLEEIESLRDGVSLLGVLAAYILPGEDLISTLRPLTV
jgi:hypothetical protein